MVIIDCLFLVVFFFDYVIFAEKKHFYGDSYFEALVNSDIGERFL